MKDATTIALADAPIASTVSGSWRMATLGDVCDINPRKPKDVPHGTEVTFVPMPAVDEVTGAITVPQTRKYEEVRKGYTAFQNGDVLLAKITPCMENGKAAIARDLLNGIGFGSTEFHVLRPKATVLAEYVYHYIRQKTFRRAAEANMTGSVGQKRVPVDWLRSQSIPVPSIEAQHEIVRKIEAALPRLRDAQEGMARAKAVLHRFRQSILQAAISGKLTSDWRESSGVSDNWSETELGNVVTDLGQGWSPSCDPEPSNSAETWGVIKTTAIQPMTFFENENKRLPIALKPRPSLEIRAGDLLITRAGPRERAGVCCLVQSTRPRLILCDKAYRFHAVTEQVIPDYLEILLNAPSMLFELDKIKTGISDSGLNLTQKKFLSLSFTLPPLAEQVEIIKRVRSYFEIADRVEKFISKTDDDCELLVSSILLSAFSNPFSVPVEAQ